MSVSEKGDGWFVEVTSQPLDASTYLERVSDPGAGALSMFVGVTRNSFQGRRVLQLEYEAYVPMAIAQLRRLCEALRGRWAVSHVAMAHRTGVVAVGEASVVIAVSAPHRAPALEASVCGRGGEGVVCTRVCADAERRLAASPVAQCAAASEPAP
jgi:molybdopterin synthase catalytic subunit